MSLLTMMTTFLEEELEVKRVGQVDAGKYARGPILHTMSASELKYVAHKFYICQIVSLYSRLWKTSTFCWLVVLVGSNLGFMNGRRKVDITRDKEEAVQGRKGERIKCKFFQ